VTKTVNFANGGEIPVIGFGTWQIKGQTCVDAVRTALRSDYRHVDTATMYGNEAEVGVAWQDSGLPRDDVFLTTKLPPRLAGRRTAHWSRACTASAPATSTCGSSAARVTADDAVVHCTSLPRCGTCSTRWIG